MKLSPTADELAARLKANWNRNCDWEMLRDAVDISTGGDHPTMRLDRLTDTVKRRLPAR
jgi:hypothetical protein